MKQILLMVYMLALVTTQANAEEGKIERDPVLLKVEKSLRSALAQVVPEPSFEYPAYSKSLVVKHRTRKFMVHGRTKSGKISEKAHEVEGPSYKGFMLRVHLQKAGTVNQARVPFTSREPYWRTDLNITEVAETDKQLYWALSYGTRVDKELLRKVDETVKGLGKKE